MAGEQALLLQLGQADLHRGQRVGELGLDLGVLGGELGQALEVADVALQRADALDAPCGTRVLGGDLLRAARVVPERRLLQLLLELGHVGGERIHVDALAVELPRVANRRQALGDRDDVGAGAHTAEGTLGAS